MTAALELLAPQVNLNQFPSSFSLSLSRISVRQSLNSSLLSDPIHTGQNSMSGAEIPTSVLANGLEGLEETNTGMFLTPLSVHVCRK